MKNNVLHDAQLNEELIKNGYVILRNIYSEAQLSAVQDYFYSNVPQIDSNTFQANYLYCTPDKSRSISKFLMNTLKDSLAEKFNNIRFLGGVYVTKPSGNEGVVKIHQDWNLVDESKYKSYNLWAPLTDVDEKNGALFIIPETHSLPFSIRASIKPSLYLDFNEELMKTAIKFDIKRGDAVLFENRLFHGSHLNFTQKDRVAVVIGVVPIEADFIHYHSDDPTLKEWDIYRVDDNLYIEHSYDLFAGNFPKSKYQTIGKVYYDVPPITEEKLIQHCRGYSNVSKEKSKNSLWEKISSIFANN